MTASEHAVQIIAADGGTWTITGATALELQERGWGVRELPGEANKDERRCLVYPPVNVDALMQKLG